MILKLCLRFIQTERPTIGTQASDDWYKRLTIGARPPTQSLSNTETLKNISENMPPSYDQVYILTYHTAKTNEVIPLITEKLAFVA